MNHTYTTIMEELQALAEDEYKAFNRKIIPTRQEVLGVRLREEILMVAVGTTNSGKALVKVTTLKVLPDYVANLRAKA